MSNSTTEKSQNGLLRGHEESDWIAGDPAYDLVTQVRTEYQKMTLPGIEPSIIPRGKSADARLHLMESLADKLDLRREYDAWVQSRDGRTDYLTIPSDSKKSTLPKYGYEPLPEPRAAGIGEMWWARTDWGWPATGSGTTSSILVENTSRGLSMSGHLKRVNGDLWQASINVVAQFVLSPDRMPPGGPGRFTSQPTCTLDGPMTGFTQDHWGDNWSKCFLRLDQIVHGGPGGPIIGQGHERRTLINLSQDNEIANISLPGFLRFPRVDFALNPAHPVTTLLGLNLDFQLEGYAGLAFGRTVGTNLQFVSALLRMSQWTINRF
ncbi:hypothetical protein Acor_24320 [Acrocarpospora corrugata]|uniref:Uncharacterized protein n=1 Tax=Acrocarpospora corrugata TaxID=35763 RepID=A0A5M3W176_9ACTN|nr:hypothetical protein [Acrocarpospora corrugata]GES00368.1 hypothetical protein Acor_24320 [Acrocarpospora corrugata]